MPTINKTHHLWSAREVLYARCAHCEFVLNWVNCRETDGRRKAATCCDLAYACEFDEDNAPYFLVSAFEVDMTNVHPLF